jgi:Tfp pilus assembly protein PilX
MLNRLKSLRNDESGFALVSVLVLLIVGTLFAIAAWSASKADTVPSARDRDSKQAYAAAEAGINFYLFRLGQNNAYWSDCATIPSPNQNDPVSLAGATTLKWKSVQGATSQYAIELMPQNGVSPTGNWCTPGSTAAASLLDAASGTLQIRSTGKSGSVRRSIVVTMRRTGFLDYLYFTDYETEDPQVSGSGVACNVYRRAGRSNLCSTIVFGTDDAVKGPFHTNDDIVACGTPDFGRSSADNIEVSAPPQGWAAGCGGSASPNFIGTWKTSAAPLTLPSSNSQLQSVAASGYLFTGTTQITLNNNNMDVTNNGTTQTQALPSNGVIYVKSGASCGASYNGTGQQSYNEPAGCGNVYVQGTATRSLTIGADRDIIVTGDLKRSGNVLIGLVANYFIRVYHPVTGTCPGSATNATTGPFGAAPPSTGIEIDAAILSLGHSFIVDNYKCGASRGQLTVKGAIAQFFRGPVGTVGGTGYIKDYNYDDRFRVANPPYFLDPVQSAWRKIRFNEEIPARQGG